MYVPKLTNAVVALTLINGVRSAVFFANRDAALSRKKKHERMILKTAIARQQRLCLERFSWAIENDYGHDIVQQGLPSVYRGQLLCNSVYLTKSRADIGD
jgi:hypothetical protein